VRETQRGRRGFTHARALRRARGTYLCQVRANSMDVAELPIDLHNMLAWAAGLRQD
jgi:hypothetical protein